MVYNLHGLEFWNKGATAWRVILVSGKREVKAASPSASLTDV